MPALSISAIVAHPVPRTGDVGKPVYMARLSDRVVSTSWEVDRVTSRGPGFEVRADALTDAVTGLRFWGTVTAVVREGIDSDGTPRLNRLLAGLGLPKVEWYHRTGKTVLRAPGRAIDLPVALRATRASNTDAWSLSFSPLARPTDAPSDAGTVAGIPPEAVAAVRASAGITTPSAPIPLAPVVPAVGPNPTTPTVREAAAAAVAEEGEVTAAVAAVMARGVTESEVLVAEPEPRHPEPVKVQREATVAHHDPLGIFRFPRVSKETAIVVSDEMRTVLGVAWKQHVAGKRQVVLLAGPTGTGKSSLVYDLAAREGIGVFKYDAAGASTFADWVGATGVEEVNGAPVTRWQPSALIEAIRADGQYAGIPRLILIDEVNRSESAASNNALMAMTDHLGSLYIPDERRAIPLDPMAMVVFTANVGSNYNATNPVDAALQNRIKKVFWLDYPDFPTEVSIVRDRVKGIPKPDVEALVKAAGLARKAADRGDLNLGISTRQVLAAADDVADGLTPHMAATYAWVNGYDAEGGAQSQRAVVQSIIDGALRR